MKKNSLYFLLVALLGFTTSAVQAQVGSKAGVTYSSVSQNAFEANVQDLKEKSTIGFQAGIFAELPIGDVFAIQPELNFMQKGENQNTTSEPAVTNGM